MPDILKCILYEHDIRIVLISVILCGIGSWVTTGLYRRYLINQDSQRKRWYFQASLFAGMSVWCTHFVATLGYKGGTLIHVLLSLTFLSFLVAIVGYGIGFSITRRLKHWKSAPFVGGIFTGLSASAMHYMGIYACYDHELLYWDLPSLGVSVALAVVFSSAALFFAGKSEFRKKDRILSAGFLTLSVLGLHFTGMSALSVIAPGVYLQATDQIDISGLTFIVSAMGMTIMLSGFVTYVIDGRSDHEQARLLHMIDDMPVAVMTVEQGSLKINYVNETSRSLIRAIEHLLPVKADDLIGTSIDVFHRNPEYQRAILADPRNLPHNARIRLGSEILDLKISAVNDDEGRYIGPMLTWAIVTKEVAAENRITQLARYDFLTGIFNRNTFHEKLKDILEDPESRFGLLFADLDGFKAVNDTHGHRVGDVLLEMIARRLEKICESHGGEVFRLGGDEFAIITTSDDYAENEKLAEIIISEIEQPYRLEKKMNLYVGASMGIAFSPEHGRNGDTLLARADMALYAAKNAGRRTVRVFTDDMERRLHEHMRLESDLREALQKGGDIFVFYQPIIDIESGKITAREALVRWHTPERGWISPAEFILVAEQSELIGRLGEIVLEAACHDAAQWLDAAYVAVNVSARQLGYGGLLPVIVRALENSGLPPERLEIEITETALFSNEAKVVQELHEIRNMGVRIALDDFGTGFSSLSQLREFSFDKIKIDGLFVQDAVTRPDCAAIIRAIADIGTRLSVTIVAEGVETPEQLQIIRDAGCKEAQGYIFGKPSKEIHYCTGETGRKILESLQMQI